MRVSRNHLGYRIGQSHPAAKLSDARVRWMRALHTGRGYGYGRLAKIFRCGVSTARDICTYRTRWSA